MKESDVVEKKNDDGMERYYKMIFEDAPISLWEVDFSGILGYLELIKENGFNDIEEYFELFPDNFTKTIDLLEILNVNKAAKKLMKAKSKKQLKKNVSQILTEKAKKDFIQGLLAIDKGEKKYTNETTIKNLKGKVIHVLLSIIAIQKEGELLSNMVVSIADITTLQKAQQKEKYLNSILKAIRNINQEITKEKNRNNLIQKVCDLLVFTEGINSAWIVLFDENGDYDDAFHANIGKEFSKMDDQLKMGKLMDCMEKSLNKTSVLMIKNPEIQCEKCLFANNYINSNAMCIRLYYTKKLYGMMIVSVSKILSSDNDIKLLLKEIAGDIAFALKKLELESKGKDALKKLRESEEKFRTLFEDSQDGVFILGRKWKSIVVNKALEEITGFTSGELLKMDFKKLFVYPKQRKKLKNKMKDNGFVKRFELGLRKKDSSIRNCILSATTRHSSRGTIIGYQGIIRDITENKLADKRLKERESELSQIVQGSSIATFVIDREHKVKHWNKACESLTSVDAIEMVGTKDAWKAFYPNKRPVMAEIIVDGASMEKMNKYYIRCWESSLIKEAFEGEGIFPLLGNKWLSFTATPLKDSKGKIIGAIETLQDITEHKRRGSERELSQIIQGNPIPTFVIDSEHKVTHWNKAMEKLTGVDADRMVRTKDAWKVFYPEVRPVMAELMVDEVAEEVVAKYYPDKYKKSDLIDGAYEAIDSFPQLGDKVLFFTAKPLKGDNGNTIGAIETLQDFTERRLAEEKLYESLKEKEVLLQQIHHGVYNNLQEVSSMLKLQSRRISDEQVEIALRDTQNRIESMGLLHEQLYLSKNFSRLDFSNYIRKLTHKLYDAYCVKQKRIKLILNIDKVFVGIDRAVPCGLIINELVSNSLKYAFPNDRKGEIRISLHMNQENKIELTVGDNGIGLSEDLDIYESKTMGLLLITLQAEQIESSIQVNITEGTEFVFTFQGVR